MSAFTPCPGCARHVSAADLVCPFCGAVTAPAPQRRKPARRLGRAATFAFGAALAASACSDNGDTDAGADAANQSDTGVPGGDAGSTDDAGIDAGATTDAGRDAGSASDDAGADAGSPEDAGTDSGGIAPPYGAPPRD